MEDFSNLYASARKQYGLLTTAQLLESGYSERMISTRVRDGELIRKGHRVLQLATAEHSWEQDLLAAVWVARRGAAASHRSAARLWGFRTVDDELEIAVPFPRNPDSALAKVHRSRDLVPADVTEVDGIPVTTPERTICDLGLIFPDYEVHRILRHAIAVGLVLPHDLWNMRIRTSDQGRNWTGVLHRVLDALPERVERVESGLELHFLEVCRAYEVPRPTPQLPVRVEGRNYRLDFAWSDYRVFVEIDGLAFHSTPEQVAADADRQDRLVRAGWTPLRFTHRDLTDRPMSSAAAVKALLQISVQAH